MQPTQSTANQTIQDINKTAKELGINANLPTLSLNNLNTPPKVITPVTPATTTSDVTSFGSSLAGLQQSEQSSFEALTKGLSDTKGKTELTAEAQDAVGLSGVGSELKTINNQILAEQVGLQRQIDRIEKNPEGLFGGALEDKIADTRTESLRRQADMSVIQMGIQNRYDSAKEISDRAVAIQFERQENKNASLKATYDRYKDLFTTAEQRDFETKQADRERLLTAEKDEKKEISDMSVEALRNGASTSVVNAMRNAKTVSEAISIGGGYIGAATRAAAAQAASNAALSRRADLLKLATAGDEAAITELGYDPNNMPLTQKDMIANEAAYTKGLENFNRITGMLENNVGLESVSGTVRSPFWSGVVSGTAAGAAGGAAFGGLGAIPGSLVGAAVGGAFATATAGAKAENFLNDAKSVIALGTLGTFLEAKAQGATFGSMTESEWDIIRAASSDLASSAIMKDGKLVGFSGSEDRVRENLKKVQATYQEVIDRTNAKALSGSDRDEITNIYNQ